MNKALLSAALIAGLGIAAFAPQAARAAAATDTGTTNFQGKVLSSTCSVNAAGSGTTDGTVILPDVATSALTAVGAYAPSATSFTLALTGCPTTPAGVKVGAQFYSTNADTATGNGTLLNATGSAAGVDIQLLDGSNNPVTITTAAPLLTDNTNVTDQTSLSSGSATLDYTAEYYVTDTTTLAAGTVLTTVNYQINYQ
jgi:major type 1 subunit fimbrin (pilin)